MQLDVRAGAAGCDHLTTGATRTSRVNKFALAGATMVTASALAVAPVVVTPTTTTVPNPQAASTVDLSAFENPLAVLATTISNTLVSTGGLGLNMVEQATVLGETLGNPALQREFFESLFGTLSNPMNILRETFAFPTTYGERIAAALAGSSGAGSDAFTKLPQVLADTLGFLARGEFTLAFAEINFWFLTDGLADGRAALLDALRIPGDFLESIGLDPLARILGTSWMDEGTQGPGYGAGLLSRGVIGNLGRALLAPTVTAIFQTTEILDRARAALLAGDLVTLASEVINAPAKILNAFLNGYVPDFVTNPDSPIPPGPGQSFPGLFSPTGTFDFFFVQIPAQIARALQMEKPAETSTAARIAAIESTSPADTTVGEQADTITLDLVSTETGSAPASGDAPATSVTDQTDETVTDEADETVDVDDVTEDEAIDLGAADEVEDPKESVATDSDDTASGADDNKASASTGGGNTGGNDSGREKRSRGSSD